MIYGIASVMPRVISVILVAVLTGTIGTVDFSEQATWYIYAQFLNVLLTLGLETSFFRYYTHATDKEKVVSTSFIMMINSCIICLIIGFLGVDYWTSFFDFSNTLFLKILLITTVIDTMTVIPYAYLRVHKQSVKFMVIKILNVVILFVLSILFLVLIPKILIKEPGLMAQFSFLRDYQPGVIQVISANLIASIATLLMLMPIIIKIKWDFDRSIAKKMLNYGLPIMVGGIAYAINEHLDKLIIPHFIDENTNGIYAACYKLGVFMTLYITAFRMGAEPFFFSQSKEASAKSDYSKIMTWFVIAGSFFMLMVVSFIDLLASLFLRQAVYLQGLYIVPIILLANLFSGIYSNLGVWYKLTDKTYFGMFISIIGALLTIVTLLILIPLFGILGAAIATLITYFCMAALSYYLGRSRYPIPYQIGKIMFYISISTLLSGLSFYWFRGNYWFSALTFITYASVVYYLEQSAINSMIMPLREKQN